MIIKLVDIRKEKDNLEILGNLVIRLLTNLEERKIVTWQIQKKLLGYLKKLLGHLKKGYLSLAIWLLGKLKRN